MSKFFEYLGSVLKLGGKIGCIIIPGVISRATSEDIVTLHSQTWHLLLINIYPVRDIITVQTECPVILPGTIYTNDSPPPSIDLCAGLYGTRHFEITQKAFMVPSNGSDLLQNTQHATQSATIFT